MAGASVRTPCTGVAATSSFWASGKSFKFPSFEKKENTSLSHTSLDEFPPAKPSWSLRCRGSTDAQLLWEAAAASCQSTPRNLWHILRVYPFPKERQDSPTLLR